MCDRGYLEMNPEHMKIGKLYLYEKTQTKMVEGISKLLGIPVCIEIPKAGVLPHNADYPENTVLICSVGEANKWSRSIVSFSLKELPGCCGILVSYHTRVEPKYLKKGINTFLQEIKEDIARENGYTMLMATTIETNYAENSILQKTGWVKETLFKNSRTDNLVRVWTKIIKKEK